MLRLRFCHLVEILLLGLFFGLPLSFLEGQATRIVPITPQSMTHQSNASSPLEIKKITPTGKRESQVASSNLKETVESVIRDQVAALREGDFSKAYYAYSSIDFQKAVPFETFKSYVKKSTPLFRNRSFTSKDVTFSGVLATVKGQLEALDGRHVTVKYDLINEHGSWKVRKIDILVTY